MLLWYDFMWMVLLPLSFLLAFYHVFLKRKLVEKSNRNFEYEGEDRLFLIKPPSRIVDLPKNRSLDEVLSGVKIKMLSDKKLSLDKGKKLVESLSERKYFNSLQYLCLVSVELSMEFNE